MQSPSSAERILSVKAHSGFRKELALTTLVLTQIMYVVGSGWVGTAAKLGTGHIVFWLAAIALFAIPLFAAHRLGGRPPLWLKIAACLGLAISILYSVLSVFPIIVVKDWRSFTAKIVAVLVLTNLIGLAIYAAGRRTPARPLGL